MTDDNVEKRSAEDWDRQREFTKRDFDHLRDGGEIRFEFHEESMMSFLDRAYSEVQSVPENRGRVVAPAEPATSTTDLMLQMKRGIQQYNEPFTGMRHAFAVLVNPVDKMAIQGEWIDATGADPTELMDSDSGFAFEGLILQAASFVEERKYMVLGKDDYEKLVEANRGQLD